MTIPRRDRKLLLGEEGLVGLYGLLNLTFLIPMRLSMLRTGFDPSWSSFLRYCYISKKN